MVGFPEASTVPEPLSECHQAPLRLHTHYGQDGEMLRQREECLECRMPARAWRMACQM